jgi:hypothetical protein
MPQTFIQAPDTPKRAAFIAAYQQLSRSERMPSPSAAAQGYDAMLLLAAAIRQSGTTHGSRVREALENLKEKVEGVIMTYDRPFSRSDHEAIDSPGQVAMGEVRGGRVVRAHDDNIKKKTGEVSLLRPSIRPHKAGFHNASGGNSMRPPATLLAVLAGAWFFSIPAFGAEPDPIRIGLTCPFTGGSAPMGESLRNAVRWRSRRSTGRAASLAARSSSSSATTRPIPTRAAPSPRS